MAEDMILAERAPVRVWVQGGTRRVLAMHCSLAHSGAWSGLATRLKGVTVTAMDQPGHGRSPVWDRVTDLHNLSTEIARDVAVSLAEGNGPIDLIGHSFGGTICLRLALERPDLVRSLVLVEPVLFAAARGTPAFDGFRRAHEEISRMIRENPAAGAAAFQRLWGTGEALEDLPERQRNYIVGRIHHIAAQTPVLVDDRLHLCAPGRIESLNVPVLLVEGADSPPIVDAVQETLARRLPQASRLIVPGAGHMVPLTHPDLVARAVQAHLEAC